MSAPRAPEPEGQRHESEPAAGKGTRRDPDLPVAVGRIALRRRCGATKARSILRHEQALKQTTDPQDLLAWPHESERGYGAP